MLQKADRPIAAYSLALFALLLYIVDAFLQWYFIQKKSPKYCSWKLIVGAIIFAWILALMLYIELGEYWKAGLRGLLDVSLCIILMLQLIVIWRLRGTIKDTKQVKYLPWGVVVVGAIATTLMTTGFLFNLLDFRQQDACILLAVGKALTEACLTYQGTTFASLLVRSGNHEKRGSMGGVVLCSVSSGAAAVASLALLWLPQPVQLILGELIIGCISATGWIALQGYKLSKSRQEREVGHMEIYKAGGDYSEDSFKIAGAERPVDRIADKVTK